jgi:hypothetical protein
VRRRETIDQMEPNFIRKQIGFITDRATEECAWPCVDRKSVSPDENSISISSFGRIAPAHNDRSRKQVFAPFNDPAEPQGQIEPVIRRAFDTDAKSNSVSDWVAEIGKVWARGRGPASTLELARLVSAARNALPRGGWTALWKARKMAFGRSKGAMLLGIWRGLNWANVQTFGHLPAGWSILYELAKLDRATLERLIEEEAVKPTLTLSEARQLVAQLRGKSLKKKSPRTNLRERLRRIENFLCAIRPHCSPAEKQLARATLSRLLEQFHVAEEPDRSPILIKVAD